MRSVGTIIAPKFLIVLCFFQFLSAQDLLDSKVQTACESVADIDLETCKPEHFDIPALKSICENMGLNVENDVFPFLFLEEEPNQRNGEEFVRADYVAAAYECISFADDIDFENSIIENISEDDPETFKEIIKEIMRVNPDIIETLLNRLEEDIPNLKDELSEGQTFLDSQDIVIELFRELIHEESDLFSWDKFLDKYDFLEDDVNIMNSDFPDRMIDAMNDE
eukprot:CAMPEP_0194181222 /NCGR_PEP_ID=MMETSP0154-20130528/19988_1 /TAXON_ID=1049557 /ORGANISM="Thalassiothrix antarctica, Strain L6-D1" /LENGTH=222 /DNA_ID=CAMNT_0038897143 /DNA_START=183 /DNA_END=848 /DNA_ORIENTATION=-